MAPSVVALFGVTIMVGGAVADRHLFGDVLAFGMTLCMAIMMLIVRQHHETPTLPAACLSWPFAAPFDVSTIDLLSHRLGTTTQFGLGFVSALTDPSRDHGGRFDRRGHHRMGSVWCEVDGSAGPA